MPAKTHQSLRVVLRPSRIGAIVAVVLHALAIVAALDAPDPWLSAGLLAVVLASARVTWRNARGCAGPAGVRVIERDGAGRWWLETCAGDRLEGRIGAPPLVSRPLVAVSFRGDGRRWDLALLPDSADPGALRRLRTVLRTGS